MELVGSIGCVIFKKFDQNTIPIITINNERWARVLKKLLLIIELSAIRAI